MLNVASTFWSLATARYCFLLFKAITAYGRCLFPLDNSGHFLCVSATSGLPVKLLCIFAFEAWCLLHSDRRWLIDKIRLHRIHIRGSVFFKYILTCEFAVSCSKPCHDYSVFSFHVVGRHCLIEILDYIMSFCFFGGVPYFVPWLFFNHGMV